MRNRLGWVGVLLLAVVLAGVSSQDDGKAQLEKAKYLLETKGDIEGTLKILTAIVAAPTQARETAALAQYFIGICYEKQGAQAARKAFQDVIDRFPEQPEAVKLAKERLAAMASSSRPAAQASDELRIRKVWGPGAEAIGSVSPDGRFLAYVKDGAGDLYIRDLMTMADRKMTEATFKEPAQYALFSGVWAKDGKSLAFNWFNRDSSLDLRLLDVASGSIRVLSGSKERSPNLLDWSKDNRSILVTTVDNDNQYLSLISILNGEERVIRSRPRKTGTVGNARFSPDGRFIAFEIFGVSNPANRDLSILDMTGSGEKTIVQNPGDDLLMGWSPEGKSLVFLSNRSGSHSLYSISLENGIVTGDPVLLKSDLGRALPMGISSQGVLFYYVSVMQSDVFLAEFDLDALKMIIPPKKLVKSFEGHNDTVELSPDGKRAAFLSVREGGGNPFRTNTIGILDIETQTEKSFGLDLELALSFHLSWALDSRSLYIRGTDSKRESGWYKIDTDTGKVELVLPFGKEYFPQISSDGKFAIGWITENGRYNKIIKKNLRSGEVVELWMNPISRPYFFTLSPNSRFLCFVNNEKSIQSLSIIDISSGEVRVLLQTEPSDMSEVGRLYHPAWVADSKTILVGKKNGNSKYDLWKVPIDGTTPTKLDISGNMIRFPAYHPGTRRLVFSDSNSIGELWAIENFLPKK